MIKDHSVNPTQLQRSLVEVVRERARTNPEQTALLFFDGDNPQAMTYGWLEEKARAIAGFLQSRLSQSERVALFFTSGPDFVSAFMGCLYGGFVAVPLGPPRQDRRLFQMAPIVSDCGSRLALTSAALYPCIEACFRESGLEGLQLQVIDALPDDLDSSWEPAQFIPDRLAYLQYTAGTNGEPRGVVVSCDNLNSALHQLKATLGACRSDISLNWLPVYHPEGLIYGLLLPLLVGYQGMVMSASTFLRNPLVWLQALMRYKVTLAGGPNFTYEQCLKTTTTAQRASLNLHCLRVAYNTTTPLPADSLECFTAAFRPSGFRPEAFLSCYAAIEATSFVCGSELDRLPQSGNVPGGSFCRAGVLSRFAASGFPVEMSIAIINPQDQQPCREGDVGEIWLRGGAVGLGYWDQLERSSFSFAAKQAEDRLGVSWLRSGDLGRLWHGQLLVTGRFQEVIVSRGVRYDPTIVEQVAAAAHPLLSADAAAAFSVFEDDVERVVVVLEVPPQGYDARALCRAVQEALAQDLCLAVAHVLLSPAWSIPRTNGSSIQRYLARAHFLHQRIQVLMHLVVPPAVEDVVEHPFLLADLSLAGPVVDMVTGLFGKVLGSPVKEDLHFFQSGGNSLDALYLAHLVREAFLVNFHATTLLGTPTPLGVALHVKRLTGWGGSTDFDQAGNSHLDSSQAGAVPIAPAQEPYLGRTDLPANHSICIEFEGHLHEESLVRSLVLLRGRHELLRTCFNSESRLDWHSQTGNVFERRGVSTDEALLQMILAEEALPFEGGEPFRFILFSRGPTSHVLFLLFHRIIADHGSLNILAQELLDVYQKLIAGDPIILARAGTFCAFAQRQKGRRKRTAWTRRRYFWRQKLASLVPLVLPTDRNAELPVYERGELRTVLNSDTCSALQRLAQEQGVTPYILLLAMYQVLLHRLSGQRQPAIKGEVWAHLFRHLPTLGPQRQEVFLCTNLSGNPRFTSLLDRVKTTVAEAWRQGIPHFEWLEHPFEVFYRRSVGFLMVPRPKQTPEIPGLTIEYGRRCFVTDPSDFTLIVDWHPKNSSTLVVHYDQGRFSERIIEQYLVCFKHIIAATLTNPALPIGVIPLLRAAPLRVCDLQKVCPDERTLHGLISLQARHHAQRTALISVEGKCSYERLERLSDALAHRLMASGLSPETPLGLCAMPGLEMVVGMLAILKVGAICLPLDPKYSAKRMARILARAKAPLLIKAPLQQDLELVEGVVVLNVELDLLVLERSPTSLPMVFEDQAAWLLQGPHPKSGSLSEILTHGSLFQLISACSKRLSISEGDVWCVVTSLSSYLAPWQLLTPLVLGASLQIASLPFVDAPFDWLVCPTHLGADFLAQASSLPQHLLLAGDDPGKGLPMSQVENSIASFVYTVPGAGLVVAIGSHAGESLPTGLLDHQSILLLDTYLNPLPEGVYGEIFLDGPGLGRGFRNDPAATATTFIPHPFEHGQRMYRAGDGARSAHQGELEFVGRLDRSTRRQGHFLQLREIETALQSHPAVAEVRVEQKNHDLFAFIKTTMRNPPLKSGFTDFLATYFPSSHLPQHYVFVPQLSTGNLFELVTESAAQTRLTCQAVTVDQLEVPAPFQLVTADLDRHDLTDAFPLTQSQLSLIYQEDMAPRSGVSRLLYIMEIESRFKRSAMEKAAQKLMRAYPVLRTSFALSSPGGPIARVHSRAQVLIQFREAEGGPLALAEELSALAGNLLSQEFSLDQAPLLRFAVLKDKRRFHLMLCAHAAILDADSAGTVLSRLVGLYFNPLSHPPERVPSGLSALWVAREQAALGKQTTRSFWQSYLAGAVSLPIASWHNDPPAQAPWSLEEHHVRLPGSLASKLTRFACKHGLPLEQVHMTAFIHLLSQFTGCRDVLTGLNVNTRPPLAGFLDAPGAYSKILPLRLRLEPGNWLHLIEATGNSIAALMPHRDFPAPALNDFFGGSGLYSCFSFEEDLVLPQIRFPAVPAVRSTRRTYRRGLQISFTVYQRLDGTFGFYLAYDSNTVPAGQAHALLEGYQKILERLATSPETAHHLCVTIGRSRQNLTHIHLPTSGDVQRIPCLIEEQAKRTPTVTALCFGEHSLSYERLSNRSNALALALAQLSLPSEAVVAILALSPIDHLVAQLAVLKQGLICLPLPSKLQAQQQYERIVASKTAVLLVGEETSGTMPEYDGHQLHINQMPGLSDEKRSLLIKPLHAEGAAYLAYNQAGAAALLTHRALANMAFDTVAAAALSSMDRLAMVWDHDTRFFPWSVWPALISGATLLVVPPSLLGTPENLPAWFVDQRVQMAILPTVTAEQLLRVAWPDCSHLRALLSFGRGLRTYPSPNLPFFLLHHYGRCETSWTITRAVISSHPLGLYLPPLGSPVRGAQVHLLNPYLVEVPEGVTAELCFAGPMLARGYLGQPARTAAAFLPNPFGGAGERLFRSGDLGAVLPDGDLISRAERGVQPITPRHALYPSELAGLVERMPGVLAGEVITERSGKTFELYLHIGSGFSATNAAAFLNQKLVQNDLPQAVYLTRECPLDEQGHCDRAKLLMDKDLHELLLEDLGKFGNNRQLQEILTHLWANVLVLEEANTDCHFFKSGGTSLQVVLLKALFTSELDIDLRPRDLYHFPTPSLMTNHLLRIHHLRWAEPSKPLLEVSPSLALAQQRLWFFRELEGKHVTDQLLLHAVASDPICGASLCGALREVMSSQQILQAVVETREGWPFLRSLSVPQRPLIFVDLAQLNETTADRLTADLVALSAATPLPASGLPCRFLLVSGTRSSFIASFHRIVCDTASLNIFQHALAQGYQLRCGERTPPTTWQYTDFARRQKYLLGREKIDEARLYWREQLQGCLKEYVSDEPSFSAPAGTETLSLDFEQKTVVERFSQRGNFSLYTTLLSVLFIRLHLDSDKHQVLVGGTLESERQDTLHDLMGPRTNRVILLGEVNQDDGFWEVLKATRQTVLAALRHCHLPLEKLQEEAWFNLGKSSVFLPVMFELEDPLINLQLGALELNTQLHPPATVRNHLQILVQVHQQSISLRLHYNRDRFMPEQAHQWLCAYRQLLLALVAKPATPLIRFSAQPLDLFVLPDHSESQSAFVPQEAQSPMEQRLASIWMDLLGLDSVTRQDHFFKLGGHADLAVRLTWYCLLEFGVPLPLRAAYQNPRLDQMAAYLYRPPVELLFPGNVYELCRPDKLSPAQARAWFLDLLEGERGAHNLMSSMAIRGPLDIAALAWCIAATASCNIILRLIVEIKEGTPRPRCLPHWTPELVVYDLCELASPEKRRITANLIYQIGHAPFDLERNPPWRMTLLKMGADDYCLVLAAHKLIADRKSLAVLLRELGRLYGERVAGGSLTLDEKGENYFYFARHELAQLQNKSGLAAKSYWQDALQGAPPLLEMPTRSARGKLQTFECSIERIALSNEIGQALQAFVCDQRIAPTILLLAVYNLLLFRYSHQNIVVVGSPSDNRKQPGSENHIGPFANRLPLITNLAGNPLFSQLLSQVEERVSKATSMDVVPFARMLSKPGMPRALNHHPVFQTLFSFGGNGSYQQDLAELRLRWILPERRRGRLDLYFHVRRGTRWVLEFTYNNNLYDRESIHRLTNSYITLLETVLGGSDERIGYLPLMGEAEKRALLYRRSIPKQKISGRGLHQLFEDRAARIPERRALSFCKALGNVTRNWTYRELNRRANALANRLRNRGVTVQEPVCIFLENSSELMAAALAVLKLGAIQVFLDTAWSNERLSSVFEDAAANLLITTPELIRRFPERVSTLYVHLAGDVVEDHYDLNPEVAVVSIYLASICYSSSPGQVPIGVELTHGNMVDLFQRSISQLSLDESTVWLATVPLWHGGGALQWFAPLLAGGRLVIPSRESMTDGLQISYLVEEQDVNHLAAEPAVWQGLRGVGWEGRTGLTALCADDYLTTTLAVWLSERIGRLFYCYGCIETSQLNLLQPIEEVQKHRLLALETSLGNGPLLVLDRFLQRIPLGATGELFIGGNAPAQGYRGRASHTAITFLPDPYSQKVGARIFRTRDLARILLADVKDSGNRAGEVERIAEPVTRQVMVIHRKGAYHMNRGISLQDLSRPIQPMGSEQNEGQGFPQTRYVSPRNWIEEEMALIFSELLGDVPVGVHHNFFALGGTSFSAIRAITRMRQVYAVTLSLQAFFTEPTVAGLSVRVRSVLDDGGHPSEITTDRAGHDSWPLSQKQKCLWLCQYLLGTQPAWHVPFVLHLQGPLSIKAMQRAFLEVVTRHKILRISCTTDKGLPVAMVSEAHHILLPIHDLTHLGTTQCTARAEEIIEDKVRNPFEMRSTLLRPCLIRLSEQDFRLLVVMHQLIGDLASVRVFSHELVTLYSAFANGKPSPLAPLKLQFSDFVHWQVGPSLTNHHTQLEYWRSQLRGIESQHSLATDHPRPELPSLVGDHFQFTIAASLTRQLHALGRERGASLSMTLQAAFAVLLARMSASNDIVFGTVASNRRHPESEAMIGPFSNWLTLRHNLSQDMPFSELLRMVRLTDLQAFENQDVPFEEIVDKIVPNAKLNHAPLFQILFEFRNMPEPDLELEEMKITRQQPSLMTSRFDLTLSLTPEKGRLDGCFDYSCDLFEEETVAQLASHFQNLLTSISLGGEARISQLNIHNMDERARILSCWQGKSTDDDEPVLVHELFEKTANSHGQQTAIYHRNPQQAWTYDRLNQRANILANQLLKSGLREGQVVAVVRAPTASYFATLFAVLKAGGAVLSLHVSTPPLWCAAILEDAGVTLLLECRAITADLPAKVTRIRLDDIQSEQETPNPLQLSPQSVALLQYRSDGCNRPLGVVTTHCAASAFLMATRRLLGLTAESVLPYRDRMEHNLLSEEMLPLCAGSQILIEGPAQDKASVVLGATHLRLPMNESNDDRPEERELTVLVEHQQLTAGEMATYKQRFRRLWQLHAVEEMGSWWAARHLGKPVPHQARLSLGGPVGDARPLLLDSFGEVTPIGGVGNLFVAGTALASSYQNRPALTAAKFSPDPTGLAWGGRLFRCERLARQLPTGDFILVEHGTPHLLVEGSTLKPGDVEAAFDAHPDVNEIAVAWVPGSGLTAWLYSSDCTARPAEQYVAYLDRYLPRRLHPQFWIHCGPLPRTATGEIDKAMLLSTSSGNAQSPPEIPRDQDETTIAQIFAEVLNAEQVGIHDNFFHLGGHSMLLVLVHQLIIERLSVRLPPHLLLTEPTVIALAKRLPEYGHQACKLPLLEKANDQWTLCLSLAQQRLWNLHQLEGAGAQQQTLAMRLLGHLNIEALTAAIDSLTQKHKVLKAHFEEHRGVPQVYYNRAVVPLLLVDLTGLEADEAETVSKQLLEQEAAKSFTLEHGQLMRTILLQLVPEETFLLITLHYIVCDENSLKIVLKDLGDLYGKHLMQQETGLDDCLQYADFALWERSLLRHNEWDAQLAYWCRQLQGSALRLDLPTDRPRARIRSTQGGRANFQLAEQLEIDLIGLSHTQGATEFMILEALFALVLTRYSGQEEVLIGTPVAHTLHPALEGLVGHFTNSVVLRNQVTRHVCFLELLDHVRQMTQDAFAHGQVPIEQVVETLRPQPNPAHHPIFQNYFTLDYKRRQTPGLPSLVAVHIQPEHKSAEYDLALTLERCEQGLKAHLVYSTQLYDPATAQRLVGHFLTLARAVANNPEQQLMTINLVDECERTRILQEWSGNQARKTTENVHEWVTKQAKASPTAIAVMQHPEKDTLTYQQLENRANELARRLANLGVVMETPVVVYLERAADIVVALLAVHKAGGCYVPMDPAWPSHRQEAIARELDVRVLVTRGPLRSQLARVHAQSVFMEELNPIERPFTRLIEPCQSACILYTTAAEGYPAGLRISHQALAQMLACLRQQIRLPEQVRPDQVRMLATAKITTNLFLIEMYWPLILGATLVLADSIRESDGPKLEQLIQEANINMLSTGSASWRGLQVAGWQGLPNFTALTSGEPMDPELARWIIERTTALYHCYGPVETIWAVSQVKSAEPPAIESPLPGTRIYILDDHLNPAAIGVTGELCLGGLGLVRDYHRKPAQTANLFVPDPFSGEPGARLYRTRELVRWRRTGQIEILGRVDVQVEIKGYRTQLHKIETTLALHPLVTRAAVQVEWDSRGHKYLTALLSPDRGDLLTESQLKSYLSGYLPEFMIPSSIKYIDRMPLTQGGQIDRRRLMEMTGDSYQDHECSAHQRTPVEETLTTIWREVLKIKQVTITDHFFQLGGSSQDVAQVMARVGDIYGVWPGIACMFQRPTIAGLSAYLTSLLSA